MPDIRLVMSAIAQDARFGARTLARSPALTAMIVLALALGIGANSAMFSVVDAILLHPLSYENPQDLCIILDRDAQGQLRGTTAGNFFEWRKAHSFSDIAGWAPSTYILEGEEPLEIRGARVTANMFQVLGVNAFMGRTFLNGEDGLDGSATVSKVVVISYGMWRDALGSDPNVLGRTIRLNEVPFTVIGVTPPGFELVNRGHQLWVPAQLVGTNRDNRYLMVIGRRKAPMAATVAEMQSISESLADAFPGSNRGWSTYVAGMQEWLVDRPESTAGGSQNSARTRSRLLLLFASLGLVLLLACSNVAGLLLARSVSRSREMALRVSLGATQARIIGQLLAESLLLSLLGGVGGLVFAWTLMQIAPSYVTVPAGELGTSAPFELNARMVGFTLGVSVLTGILFGLAPALAASRPNVQESLQDGTRGSTGGRGRQIFRQAMVAAQVAVALALLSGAVLTVRSFQRLTSLDVGLNTTNVLAQRILLPATAFDAAHSLSFDRQVLQRLEGSPGIKGAAIGSRLPLARPGMEISFDLESDPIRPSAEMRLVEYITASPAYFSVLRIPMLAGREFENTDSENAPRVAVVNQAFAKKYFPNGDAVGQRVRVGEPILGTNDFSPVEYLRIIGVAGDVMNNEIGRPASPLLYAPMAQNVWTTAHWLAVRTSVSPTSVDASVRRTIREIDPSRPLDPSKSLDEIFSEQSAPLRLQSELMGLFATLAVLLAIIGIYSINAYTVTQRTREIGVRLALGASPGSVMRDILQQGMKLSLAGVIVGLGAAAALNSALRSVLVDVSGIEIAPMLGAAFILTTSAAIACTLPAWRATQIDPAITLRKE